MNILAKQKSTIAVCVAGVVAGYILQRLRQRATETLDKQKGLFAATGELLTQSQDVVRGVNAIVDKLQKGKLLPGPDYCPTPEEVAVEKAAWRAAVGPSMPMQIKAMLDLSNTVVARILDDERVGRILDKAGQPPPDADASADKPNVLEILDKVDNIVTKAVHAEENLVGELHEAHQLCSCSSTTTLMLSAICLLLAIVCAGHWHFNVRSVGLP